MKIWTKASVTFVLFHTLFHTHAATATLTPQGTVPSLLCIISSSTNGTLGFNNGFSLMSTEQAANGGQRGSITLTVTNANGNTGNPSLSISRPTLTLSGGEVALNGNQVATIYTPENVALVSSNSGTPAVSSGAGTYTVSMAMPLVAGQQLAAGNYTASATVTCS
jgi:hypothetical protein